LWGGKYEKDLETRDFGAGDSSPEISRDEK